MLLYFSCRLQPLDVSFMKPLSLYYDESIRIWLRNHPGRVVSIYQIAELFGNLLNLLPYLKQNM